MGSTTKRTFEENVELIADSLAQIVERQDKLLAIAKRNSEHICGTCREAQPDAPPETPSTPDAPAADTAANGADPANYTYEQLKFALIQRGVEIPKGTKMTTLRELWETHKFDDLKPGATTVSGVEAAAAQAAEGVPPTPEKAAEAQAADATDIFGEPAAPAAPKAEPMTREQAVKTLSAMFHDPALPEERDLMLAKVAEFGVPHFRDIPEDKLGEFVAAVKAALK